MNQLLKSSASALDIAFLSHAMPYGLTSLAGYSDARRFDAHLIRLGGLGGGGLDAAGDFLTELSRGETANAQRP